MSLLSDFLKDLDKKYLGKKPGEFTPDEIDEIGIEFRRLPVCERNWEVIAERVGFNGNPVSYRKRAGKAAAERCLTPSEEAMISDPDGYRDYYRAKTTLRDVYHDYRSNLRKEARTEEFYDRLIETIKNQPPLKVFKKEKVEKTVSDVEAVALLSDLHLGACCKNFYNTYNSDVACSRLSKYADDIVKYCRKFNVSTLNVLNLGDLIHGIIHIDSRIQAEFDLCDQISSAANVVAQFLVFLENELPGVVINYRSCTDNHARIFANKKESIEVENFSRIIDEIIELRLKNADSSVNMINDNIDASLGRFSLKNGKTAMFAHGHLDQLSSCVDSYICGTKEYVDYVFLAHYHEPKEDKKVGCRIFINGSIVGTESYGINKRLFGDAEQKLIIFDDNAVVDLNINLQF